MILLRSANACVTLRNVPDETPENPDEVEGLHEAAGPCEDLISPAHVENERPTRTPWKKLRWWRGVVLLPSLVSAPLWRGPDLASRYRSRGTSAFRAMPQGLSVVRSTIRWPCGSTSDGSRTGRTGR